MSSVCYVVGGGTSLSTFDYSWLSGKDVIVVNQSLFHVPNAKYFITMDYTWVLKNGICDMGSDKRKMFLQHPAEKFFVVSFSGDRLGVVNEWHVIDHKFDLPYDLTIFDRVVHVAAHGGMGRSYKDFRCGRDSGYSAIQLAVIEGYTEIYLLGYDFRATVQGTHFHSDYVEIDRATYDNKLEELMVPYPKALDVLRSEYGVHVYSCSVMSRLNCHIPYRNLEG